MRMWLRPSPTAAKNQVNWRSFSIRSLAGWALPGAVLLVPFLLALGAHHDPEAAVALTPAQAWLSTQGSNKLALVDGPSASFVTDVSLSAAEAQIVQAGNDAYTLDPSTRAVTKVSGTTYQMSALTGVDWGSTQSLASGGDLYVSAGSRLARVTVDGQRKGSVTPGPSLPNHFRLASTGAQPAVADLDKRTVTWFKGQERTGSVQVGNLGTAIKVTGDEDTGDVYLVNPKDGTVTACWKASATCEPIPGPTGFSGQLGQPVVAAGRLLIPEPAASRVWAVGAEKHVVTPLAVFTHGLDFQLVVAGGYTFANPPGSINATVIDPRNGVKLAPKHEVQTVPPSATTKPSIQPTQPRRQPDQKSSPRPTQSPTRAQPTTRPSRHPTTESTKPSKTRSPSKTKVPKPPRTTKPPAKKPPAKKPPTTKSPTKRPPSTSDVTLTVRRGTPLQAHFNVHEAPDDDHEYFLLVKVEDMGYFAHAELRHRDGPQDANFKFPTTDVDKDLERRAFVVSATGGDIEDLRRQLRQDVDERPALAGPHGIQVSNSVQIRLAP